MDFFEALFAGACSAALFAAHRALVASPMAFLAEALIFLRLVAAGVDAVASGIGASPFSLAQRAFWAAAIFRREEALNFRRLPAGVSETPVDTSDLPQSIPSTSAICS